MIATVTQTSIMNRAFEKGLVKYYTHDLRQFATDNYGTIDDRPFGGGVGMILKIEPIFNALTEIKRQSADQFKTILLDPKGEKLNQQLAEGLVENKDLMLICPHYEGVDDRVREHLIDQSISIGDYIISSGELAALVLADSIVRLIPGVIKKTEATIQESFSLKDPAGHLLLEYPQYTRPEEFNGWKVPEILLSGDHAKIGEWQAARAIETTQQIRPDLLN